MLPNHDVPDAARRLRELSLLVDTDDGVWVHRWTAEALREHQSPDDDRERCQRAGESRLRRIQASPVDIEEGIEATENLLAAGDLDQAAGIGLSVADFLRRSSTSCGSQPPHRSSPRGSADLSSRGPSAAPDSPSRYSIRRLIRGWSSDREADLLQRDLLSRDHRSFPSERLEARFEIRSCNRRRDRRGSPPLERSLILLR
jgi:hypothetical protein